MKILLEKNYRIILNFVDFKLEKGITLISGPNASGKSSLLKVLAGIFIPDMGKVFLDGKDITLLPPSERVKLGIVLAPERMKIALNLTVEDNLRFSDVEKAYEFFPELKKISKRRGKDLSGGERQMVVLARALAMDCRFLLLDEPFQGLHGDIRIRLIRIIKEISNRAAVAVVTHDEIEEVLKIAEKIYVLVSGKTKFSGNREEGEIVIKEMFL